MTKRSRNLLVVATATLFIGGLVAEEVLARGSRSSFKSGRSSFGSGRSSGSRSSYSSSSSRLGSSGSSSAYSSRSSGSRSSGSSASKKDTSIYSQRRSMPAPNVSRPPRPSIGKGGPAQAAKPAKPVKKPKVRTYDKAATPHTPVNKYTSFSPKHGMYSPSVGYFKPGYFPIYPAAHQGMGFFETYLLLSFFHSPGDSSTHHHYHNSVDYQEFAASPDYQEYAEKFKVTQAEDVFSCSEGDIFKIPETKSVDAFGGGSCQITFGSVLVVSSITGSNAVLNYIGLPETAESGPIETPENCSRVIIHLEELKTYNAAFIEKARTNNTVAQKELKKELGVTLYKEFEVDDDVTICSGSTGGIYLQAANKIRAAGRSAGLKVGVTETAGSMNNLMLMAEGHCNVALAQGDVIDEFQSNSGGFDISLVQDDELYREYAHLVCNQVHTDIIESVKDLEDEGEKQTVYIGREYSGTALVWAHLVRLDSSYAGIKAVNLDPQSALQAVLRDRDLCFFDVSGLGSPFMQETNDRYGDFLFLAELDDWNFNNDGAYEFDDILSATYPKLLKGIPCKQGGACASSKRLASGKTTDEIETITVGAYLVVDSAWTREKPDAYQKLKAALEEAKPEINKLVTK